MTTQLERELKTLRYGDHICPIYESRTEQMKQRVQFIKQGLANGNRCLYLLDDTSPENITKEFSDAGIDISKEQKRGALRILTKNDIFLDNGKFDGRLMLDFLDKLVTEALNDGFSGLWYLVEKTWVLGADINDLQVIEFEARLNDFLIDKPCVVFCQYTEDLFDLSWIHDVLLTHPLAMLNGLICPNPYYQPSELVLRPEQIATSEYKRLRTSWWIHQLKGIRNSELGRYSSSQPADDKRSRFRTILDSLFTFVGILTNDGIVLDVNQVTLNLSNIKREDIVGKPFVDTYWWSHSIAAQKHLRELLESVKEGSTVREDFNLILSEKHNVSMDMTFVPILNEQGSVKEIVVSGVDVTKRVEIEKALQDSELLFRQLVENIEEVFWVSDAARTKIIYISPAFEKIWGITPQSLYDDPKQWIAVIHPEDRQRVEAAYFSLDNEYNVTYRIITKNGVLRWIRARSFAVNDEDGKPYRMVGVAEDITVFRRLEDQFYQAQKMEAVGKLAGGISHDFNNLLAVMKSNIALLMEEKNLTKDTLQFVTEIEKAANRAADLTRQLLMFSRQKAMKLDKVDVNQVVSNIAKMLKSILGENIKLELKLADKAQMVQVDTAMIDQVLMNLIVNARDAMEDGGKLLIDVAAKSFDENTIIQLPRGARTGSFVCISVSDTGSGISPEVLPKIFEPFFTTKDVDKGTGLGLSTVYGILKQHNGWINVYSEPRKGTTFRIYLPTLDDGFTRQAKHKKEATLEYGKGETILLVEDEASLRSAIKIILLRCGYKVMEAEDVESALTIWDANQNKIDLLLTDLILPKGRSGKDLAREVLNKNPQMKIIYMSGYSAEIVSPDLPLKEGINFLLKPFEMVELSRILHDCLYKNNNKKND